MRQFLYFETMLAPKFIIVFFWLQLALYSLLGLGMVISAVFAGRGLLGALFGIVVALVVTAIMLMIARISAEVLIVIFKINENLKKIADRHIDL